MQARSRTPPTSCCMAERAASMLLQQYARACRRRGGSAGVQQGKVGPRTGRSTSWTPCRVTRDAVSNPCAQRCSLPSRLTSAKLSPTHVAVLAHPRKSTAAYIAPAMLKTSWRVDLQGNTEPHSSAHRALHKLEGCAAALQAAWLQRRAGWRRARTCCAPCPRRLSRK